MTPETKSAVKGAMQAACTALVTLTATVLGTDVQAQSVYACKGLETHTVLPAVEGKAGTFFAIRPELQAHHGLGDHTIDQLAKLTQILATRGTTLVFMPVPTRPQVMQHLLPSMAAHLGFDADVSTAVHLDMIARLETAGVNVADAHSDLRRASFSGTAPFFGTDMRPTGEGMRLLAQSIGRVLDGHPNLTDAVRLPVVSVPGDEVVLPSDMRVQLQTACQSELPKPSVQTQVTVLSGDATADRLVVIGTDITATDALNITGFLMQSTGMDTSAYGVTDGGAFAAMSSYLTSPNFQQAPPRVLVWEWPVVAPFANKGDQPMRELIAAAKNDCAVDLAMTDSRANLTDLNANATLTLNADGAALPYVRFHFTDTNGLVRTRSVYRHPDQILTGRFYVPLLGLDVETLVSVQIEAPIALSPQSRLSVCS